MKAEGYGGFHGVDPELLEKAGVKVAKNPRPGTKMDAARQPSEGPQDRGGPQRRSSATLSNGKRKSKRVDDSDSQDEDPHSKR